jgi:uncharacterized membrane protein (DUF106 family)
MGVVSLLDPVLGWMLVLPMWFSLLLFSLFMTIVLSLVQKFATDQSEMKYLKEQVKKSQKELKKHKEDPKKMAQVQQQAMQANMRYTMKSMKPTLFTIVPFLFLFAWLSANFAYDLVGEDVFVPVTVRMVEPARLTIETDLVVQGEMTKDTVERQATWQVAGPPGRHLLTLRTEDGQVAHQPLYIGEQPEDVMTRPGGSFDRVEVRYPKATPFGDFSIGNYKPGWLMTYFFFSVALTIIVRRLLKVY